MSVLRRLTAGAILARANLRPFERPDRLASAALAMAPWGTNLAGVVAASAARDPGRVAIVDEHGRLTYAELWDRARSIAAGLTAMGVQRGTSVGLLARNHRGFVEWLIGISATGADVVLLNTGFAGPQLADVVTQEQISWIVHDDEFAEVVSESPADALDEAHMNVVVTTHARPQPTRAQGRMVILTSGTTGRPKGASRRQDAGAIEGVAAVLDQLPYRFGDTQVVAAPLFHAWGLTNLLLGLGRCATTVIARRFDAEATLRATSEEQGDSLVLVPAMLSRILALPPEVLVSAPTPKLRVIASSGSALGSRLATDALGRFGPVLYNLYGSTEVAVASIATPQDLLRAPSTAGRPVFGVRVEILDAAGVPVAPGTVGRVFVGGAMRFDGYTTGGGKEQQRGLLSSGDLGYFSDGLLFVVGREDDMIVSGGENVYPTEVEELLSHHPGVADVAVVGVPDDDFGQALAAFVVRRPRSKVGEDELRTHVRNNLARHKVPRRVHFVDELPRNPAGKILRRALIEQDATR